MSKYHKFDGYLVNKLKDATVAQSFLDASIAEYEQDGDVEDFKLSLRYLAEAQGGIGSLSDKINFNRQNLYKILTSKTILKLDTTLAIVKGLGYKFVAEPVV